MNLFEVIWIYLELKRIKNQIKNCVDVAANMAGSCHVAHVTTYMCICAGAYVRVCARVCMRMCN